MSAIIDLEMPDLDAVDESFWDSSACSIQGFFTDLEAYYSYDGKCWSYDELLAYFVTDIERQGEEA